MDKKNNTMINTCIAGLIFCIVTGIAAVVLKSSALYGLAFFLFACIYTISFRKYKTEENPNGWIRKMVNTYTVIYVIFIFCGLLNTYTEWLSSGTMLNFLRVLIIPLFALETFYLAEIRKPS